MRPKGAFYSPTRLILIFVLFAVLYAAHRSLLVTRYDRYQSPSGDLSNEGQKDSTSSAPETPSDFASGNKQVWKQLKALLKDARPENPPVTLLKSLDPFKGLPADVDDIPDVVNMTDTEVEKMAQAHWKYVSKLQTNEIKLQYTPGTRGIVTTASEKDLGSIVVSLAMLRRTGCDLPMEIMVSTDDIVTSAMCTDVLAAFNAKCISSAAAIGTKNPELDNNRYLNKLFALLLSSFEDNLFLDADNLPILDPATYFDEEPFKSHGLVAWPDFWPSSISPTHADVTNTVLPPVNGTVESGQLLLSKSRHANTLLLAFYYNFYGPQYYYKLESQGAVGFGDKESFLNAALALNGSYYLVKHKIHALGYWDEGKFHGPAMAQFDLTGDYHNTLNKVVEGQDGYVDPKIVFVHHNMLKLVPDNVFGSQGHYEYTKLKSGQYTRLWGPQEGTEKKFGGVDMERVMWLTLREVTCSLKKKGLLGKKNKSDACQKCDEYIKAVFAE